MSPAWLRGATIEAALGRPSNGFGVVRLALALAVVVSHAFSVTTGRVADEPFVALTGFTLGEHAVNGFFAVSGFLVAMSFARRGAWDYAVARALRIAPGLIAAALVVTFGLGAALTRLDLAAYLGDPATWRFVVGTLTTFKSNAALPGLFPDNPFRSPMGTVWTLKYEALCYVGLLAAGMAGLLRFRWPAAVVVTALFTAIVLLDALAPDAPKGQQTALRLTFLFAFGAALWMWRDTLGISWLILTALALATAALARTPVYGALLLATESYGILCLALAPALSRPAFDLRQDLSYGTYLYGWPIQQALRQLFPASTAATLLAPSLLLTLAVAAVSWRVVERPALDLKARWLDRRQRAAP